MKKVRILSAVALFLAVTATSCNKMCTCTTKYEDPRFPTEVEDVDLRAAGQKRCADMNNKYDTPNGRVYIECVNKEE